MIKEEDSGSFCKDSYHLIKDNIVEYGRQNYYLINKSWFGQW